MGSDGSKQPFVSGPNSNLSAKKVEESGDGFSVSLETALRQASYFRLFPWTLRPTKW